MTSKLQKSMERETWKAILCDSNKCINEMFISKNMKTSDNSLTDEAIALYKIYPDIDNDVMTQFTCPRCGKTITWGITRKKIQKILYEKFNK